MKIRELRASDDGYPPLLSQVARPPALLYVSGRPLEPAAHVAVVGSRRPSRYGADVAHWISSDLAAAGVTVVSGLAAGIDAAAHTGALEAGGATVAVLGSGVDVCYPRGNLGLYRRIRAGGTLVSEYPPGTRPLPHHFPERNRIIAGLSLGVVVVEGRPDGGAMITARLAGESGRDVFAVPGPVHAPGAAGPHALIRDGARLVTCAADVLAEIGLEPAASPGSAPAVSPDEQLVLGVLGTEPRLLDTVAASARLPAPAAASVLSRLELRGLVVRHGGGRFAVAVGTRRAGGNPEAG